MKVIWGVIYEMHTDKNKTDTLIEAIIFNEWNT